MEHIPISSLKSNNLHYTFITTFILLIIAGITTFSRGFVSDNNNFKNILFIETLICLISGYFYFNHLNKFKNLSSASEEEERGFTFNDITNIRYKDWLITTPLMLLVLCLILGINTNIELSILVFLGIIICNFAMIYFAYLGEKKQLSKPISVSLTYIFLISIFIIIYMTYIKNYSNIKNNIIFYIYLILWSLYGAAYFLNQENKNIMINTLDSLAKPIIALFFVYESYQNF
jgi:bacteriorhodopsin